ncbi:MAG: hypothetical protein ABSF86_13645 [Steroidobacteraceae bacterium]
MSESGEVMELDIRTPIGWMFALIGALLVIGGLSSGAPTEGVAAGLNVDAWWGAVLLLFGVGMLLLARRHATQMRSSRH